MEIGPSIEVLKSLASGTDPCTGEVYPTDSPYNQPEVIRALHACVRHIEHPPKKMRRTIEERQAENLARGWPKNAGLPWTEEMRDSLAEDFKSGTAPRDLAKRFERTLGSIAAELQKQGLITPEEARAL